MKILFVDDDSDDKEIFLEALDAIAMDIDCDIAVNGQEALARLKKIPAPEYIFLDINRPVMDGKTFLYTIKNDDKLKQIPVLIYSTADAEEARALSDLGATYIGKPASFESLKQVLRAYLKRGVEEIKGSFYL